MLANALLQCTCTLQKSYKFDANAVNLTSVFIKFEYLEIYTLLTNHTTRKNILESILRSNMHSYLINDPMNSYFKNSECSNVSKTLYYYHCTGVHHNLVFIIIQLYINI